MLRVEDRALITGRGQYVDAVTATNLAYAEIVRSPVAHAAILSIDVSQARALPGVIGVFTASEILPHLHAPLPVIQAGVSEWVQSPPQFAIAQRSRV